MDAKTRYVWLSLVVGMSGAIAPAVSSAQEASYLSEFERPYGYG